MPFEPHPGLDSRWQKPSPSPPFEGGEGWGEEGHSDYACRGCHQLDSPLPSPLPARSSRGEGVRRVLYAVAFSITRYLKRIRFEPIWLALPLTLFGLAGCS